MRRVNGSPKPYKIITATVNEAEKGDYRHFYENVLRSEIEKALTTYAQKRAEEEREKMADWILNHKGVSSTAIYSYMTTGKLPKPFDCPFDKWDRKRCVVLLKAVPEWQSRLSEIEEAKIKGFRNGIEVYPWNEQIPLIRTALTLPEQEDSK